jgi:hypothetical protein
MLARLLLIVVPLTAAAIVGTVVVLNVVAVLHAQHP